MVNTTQNLGLEIPVEATQRWIDTLQTIDSDLTTWGDFGWIESGTTVGDQTVTTGFQPRYLEFYAIRHPRVLNTEYISSDPPTDETYPNARSMSYGVAMPAASNPDGVVKQSVQSTATRDGEAVNASYLGDDQIVHQMTLESTTAIAGRGVAVLSNVGATDFTISWNEAFENYHVFWRALR